MIENNKIKVYYGEKKRLSEKFTAILTNNKCVKIDLASYPKGGTCYYFLLCDILQQVGGEIAIGAMEEYWDEAFSYADFNAKAFTGSHLVSNYKVRDENVTQICAKKIAESSTPPFINIILK